MTFLVTVSTYLQCEHWAPAHHQAYQFEVSAVLDGMRDACLHHDRSQAISSFPHCCLFSSLRCGKSAEEKKQKRKLIAVALLAARRPL